MAIGQGRMVEAPEPGVPVRVRPLRFSDLFAAARPPARQLPHCQGGTRMPQTHTPTAPTPPARVRTVIAYTRSGATTIEGQRWVQRQRTAIQAEADFQGWTVAAWTCDLGQPGTTLDRPGLKQALAMLSEHKADALVAYEEGRLARLRSHRRQLERVAKRQGWRLLTIQALRTPAPA
jgi:hypothetical protein